MSDKIHVRCPKCCSSRKAPPAMVGKSAKCPKCGQQVPIVPEPPDESPVSGQPNSNPLTSAHGEVLVSDVLFETTIALRQSRYFAEQESTDMARRLARQALTEIDPVVAAHPQHGLLWIAKGLAHACNYEFSNAADSFAKALKCSPPIPPSEVTEELIDHVESYYKVITFSDIGQFEKPEMKSLLSGLQQVLILAGKDPDLPGARAQDLVGRIRRAEQSASPVYENLADGKVGVVGISFVDQMIVYQPYRSIQGKLIMTNRSDFELRNILITVELRHGSMKVGQIVETTDHLAPGETRSWLVQHVPLDAGEYDSYYSSYTALGINHSGSQTEQLPPVQIEKWEMKKGCWVVTVCAGDSEHPLVARYRAFRDDYMLPSLVGEQLSQWYDRCGPYMAQVVARSEVLRWISYGFLFLLAYALPRRSHNQCAQKS